MDPNSVTALSLFEALMVAMPPAIAREFGPYDGCILASRIAIEVGAHYGIAMFPMSVRVVAMNKQFAKHVEEGDTDVRKWEAIDGSYSVGIGFGFHDHQTRYNKWDGHLIVGADGCFADFTIKQAERLERGIYTGEAIYGPLEDGQRKWVAEHPEAGTVIHYERTNDTRYRFAPDWKDIGRKKRIAGAVIRSLKV